MNKIPMADLEKIHMVLNHTQPFYKEYNKMKIIVSGDGMTNRIEFRGKGNGLLYSAVIYRIESQELEIWNRDLSQISCSKTYQSIYENSIRYFKAFSDGTGTILYKEYFENQEGGWC